MAQRDTLKRGKNYGKCCIPNKEFQQWSLALQPARVSLGEDYTPQSRTKGKKSFGTNLHLRLFYTWTVVYHGTCVTPRLRNGRLSSTGLYSDHKSFHHMEVRQRHGSNEMSCFDPPTTASLALASALHPLASPAPYRLPLLPNLSDQTFDLLQKFQDAESDIPIGSTRSKSVRLSSEPHATILDKPRFYQSRFADSPTSLSNPVWMSYAMPTIFVLFLMRGEALRSATSVLTLSSILFETVSKIEKPERTRTEELTREQFLHTGETRSIPWLQD